MGYEELLHYFLDQLRVFFAGKAEISLRRQSKNNGIHTDTLCILSQGEPICPSLSFSEYWKRYQNGESREELLQEILSFCQTQPPQQPWDFSHVLSYSHARPYLAPKLIHRERNRELLEQLPYQTFLDLAVVSCLCFFSPGQPAASSPIYTRHLAMWGISPENLQMDAFQNAERILPPMLLPLDTLICQVVREEVAEFPWKDAPDAPSLIQDLCGEPSQLPMYVLTNSRRYLGGANLLREDLLKSFAKQHQCGFFILPSSIHEAILIPETAGVAPQNLKEMLMEINVAAVTPEEWLSDEVYYYSAEQERILLARDGTA